ncbi:MAG: MFS transporter [Puniceicoccales bacterium]|jgi:MFS family permease|nr:MFS transporter [Puniceicoccales bacterium]
MAKGMKSDALITPLFVGLFFVQFLSFFSFQMLHYTLPLYVARIGGGNRSVGLAAGCLTFAMMCTRPLAGMLLDRGDRRRVLLISQCCLVGANLLYFGARTIPLLVAFRFLHGFFWAFAATSVTTVVADIIPRSRMGEGMGLFTMAIGVAMAIAPGVGFFAVSLGGFPNLFKLCAISSAAALTLSFFLYGKTHRGGRGEERSEGKARPFLGAAVPAALLIGSVAIVSSSLSSFLPLYAPQVGASSAIPFFSLSAGLQLLFRPVAGKLTDHCSTRVILGPALLLLSSAFIFLAVAPFPGWMFLAAAAHGISFGTLMGGLQTAALLSAKGSQYGAATATFFLGFDVGNGLGPLVAGTLADAVGYRGVYGFLSTIPILSLCLFGVGRSLWGRRLRTR